MKKIALSSLLFTSSVIAFAQRTERQTSRYEPNSDAGTFALQPASVGGDATPGGGSTVPIDNYEFLLLGIAVLMIAYFIYKRRSQFV